VIPLIVFLTGIRVVALGDDIVGDSEIAGTSSSIGSFVCAPAGVVVVSAFVVGGRVGAFDSGASRSDGAVVVAVDIVSTT